jgi:hypothetical protein
MRRVLALILLVGCTKREEAKPAPEAKASAAPVVEYTLDQMTCDDGKLGVVAAAAPSASASVTETDAGRVKGAEGTMGSVAGIFADAGSLWAPIGDGGIGLGTIGGFGGGGIGATGFSRRMRYPIRIVPDDRSARAMSVSRTICGALQPIRKCHEDNGHPVMSFPMTVDVDDKIAGTLVTHSADHQALATCVKGALEAIKFDEGARGTTKLQITFGEGRLVRGPTMKESTPTATGKLPIEIIRRVARRQVARIRYCYESALQKDATLKGKITMGFTIDSKGLAKDVKVEDATITDASVQSCIIKAFEALTFPEPESGTVSVKYPMEFSPSE